MSAAPSIEATPTAARRVLVAEASIGGVVGGSLTGALAIINRLDPSRFTVTLGTAEPKALGDLVAPTLRRVIVPRHRVPGAAQRATKIGRTLSELAMTTRNVPQALGILRRESPALVYLANGVGPHLSTVIAAALLGIPVVCHLKGFRRIDVLDRLASRHVSTAVAMTDRIASHYRDHGLRPRRFVTIPDGVDCDRFSPGGGTAVRAALGIAGTDPVVGVVGHVQEWKGQALVLDAVALARREHPRLRCLVVGAVHAGGHPYYEALRRRAEASDLAGCVSFAGARTDVAACMDAMDVVVHSSIQPEPFGRVLIEAMAVGRPVIAPREGGPLDIVLDGETGTLVEPRNSTALAGAMAALLADPVARTSMGRAARERARSVFGIDRQVERLTVVFGDALDAAPSRHTP